MIIKHNPELELILEKFLPGKSSLLEKKCYFIGDCLINNNERLLIGAHLINISGYTNIIYNKLKVINITHSNKFDIQLSMKKGEEPSERIFVIVSNKTSEIVYFRVTNKVEDISFSIYLSKGKYTLYCN